MSLNDMVDPPDWEELSARLINDRDPLGYPSNDLDVAFVPRKIRTNKHVMPEEDLYVFHVIQSELVFICILFLHTIAVKFHCTSGNVFAATLLTGSWLIITTDHFPARIVQEINQMRGTRSYRPFQSRITRLI